ncbi:hypothetical protein [uncultured Sphingomonas sp.]|uniref:hypothetical protein n=1 Tax=uncultured Sphingomonas sp. TaxID=158754 RepID=UPI0035C9C7DA
MSYILINALPILLAGLIGTAIIAVAWRGCTTTPILLATFALLSWLAAILAGALILAPVTAGVWTVALGSAFIIWIGFVLPTVTIGLVTRGVGWPRALAEAAIWLAVMLAQAVVLRAIGVVGPG